MKIKLEDRPTATELRQEIKRRKTEKGWRSVSRYSLFLSFYINRIKLSFAAQTILSFAEVLTVFMYTVYREGILTRPVCKYQLTFLL